MKKDSFAKKLAGYIAMSSAFLAAAKESDAQIIYTDVNPDFHSQNGYFNLDLNNDGIVDFKISATLDFSSSYYSSSSAFSFYTLKFSVKSLGNNKIVIDTLQFPKAMYQQEIISSNNQWGINETLFLSTRASFYWNGNGGAGSGTWGNWNTQSEKYLGLNLKVATTNYYGWARIIVDEGFTKFLTLKDYAYNNIPEQPINSGEVDCNNSTNITATPSNEVCEGENILISTVPAIPDSVEWFNGSTLVSTNQSFNATVSGNYHVVLHYLSCTDTSASISLIFNPSPSVPIITQQNDTLFTTDIAGYNYQWFFGTYPIPNSDNYFLVPQWLGSYQVTIANQYGCAASSAQLIFNLLNTISISSISENLIFTTDQHQLNLIYLPTQLTGGEIKIFDLNGKLLIEQKLMNSSEQIPLTNFSSGIYFFEIRKDEIVVRKKFFVN